MKQLKLPFDDEPKRKSSVMADILSRLARIESRLVQLMRHQGMTSDGRAPLTESKENPHDDNT